MANEAGQLTALLLDNVASGLGVALLQQRLLGDGAKVLDDELRVVGLKLGLHGAEVLHETTALRPRELKTLRDDARTAATMMARWRTFMMDSLGPWHAKKMSRNVVLLLCSSSLGLASRMRP